MIPPRTLRLHLDTEFTDFVNRDLISIGVAAENGDTFYGENADYIKAWVNPWVEKHVLPLLNLPKQGMSRKELSARLWVWIDELPCDFVIITVDYAGDYELLFDLFGEEVHPKMLSWQNLNLLIYTACDEQTLALGGNDTQYGDAVSRVASAFSAEFMEYFFRTKETQHHALSDAKANLVAWNHVVNTFNMPH